MLVLSFKTHGRIMIGPNIVIQLIRTTPDSARIAIQAPREIEIWREEIWRQMQADADSGRNSANPNAKADNDLRQTRNNSERKS